MRNEEESLNPVKLLRTIICLQIFGFFVVGILVIDFNWSDFKTVNVNEFLNFWIAFLSLLLAVIGLIVPYISYSDMKYKIAEVDKKLKEIGDIEVKLNKSTNDAIAVASFLSRASILVNFQDYKGAIEEFDEAIRINKNNSGMYNSRGFFKNELEEFIEAIPDFDRAIDLDKNSYVAYNNRGVARASLGEKLDSIDMILKAVEDYDQSIKLDPNSKLASKNKENDLKAIAKIEKKRKK